MAFAKNQKICYTKKEVIDMKNDLYYKAFSLIVNKLVGDSSEQWLFNLNYFFDNLKQICKEDIEDPYILAAIITWEFERFRNAKIKNICKYFHVKEEDFCQGRHYKKQNVYRP